MNSIEEHRRQMIELLADAALLPNEHQSETSPSGNYRIEIDIFATKEREYNFDVSIAKVFENSTGNLIATIPRDDDRFWYKWIVQGDTEYLVCAEHLEGQTVVDLTHGLMVSFTSDEDPFIWTEFYPSEDATSLAVIGCYWACPFMVIVYDFREPLSLPLPKLAEFLLPESNSTFDRWVSPTAFTMTSAIGEVHLLTIDQPSEG